MRVRWSFALVRCFSSAWQKTTFARSTLTVFLCGHQLYSAWESDLLVLRSAKNSSAGQNHPPFGSVAVCGKFTEQQRLFTWLNLSRFDSFTSKIFRFSFQFGCEWSGRKFLSGYRSPIFNLFLGKAAAFKFGPSDYFRISRVVEVKAISVQTQMNSCRQTDSERGSNFLLRLLWNYSSV